MVRLPTGDCNWQWFRELCKANQWLQDLHMDDAFWLIRWKSIRFLTTKMEAFTTIDILFGQHLLGKWDTYIKKKPIWADDDLCIRYVRGEVAGSRAASGEVASTAWAGLTTVYMPFNYRGAHWVLVKVHFKERMVTLFDSLGMYICSWEQFLIPIQTLLPLLLQKTNHYGNDTHMIADWYRKDGWSVSRCDDTPQQDIGSGDYGIFVIKLAEHMVHDQPLKSFDKSRVPHVREHLGIDLWMAARQLWGGL